MAVLPVWCCLLALCTGAEVADKNPHCTDWAAKGECESNPAYMQTECARSCLGKGSPPLPAEAAAAAGAATSAGGGEAGNAAKVEEVVEEVCPAGQNEWPCCLENSTNIDSGEAPLLVNLQGLGVVTGCFLDDCLRTDKFTVVSIEACAQVCLSVPKCQFWVLGQEDGQQKCWLRRSDAGRTTGAAGYTSAPRSCTPKGFVPMVMGNEACWMADFNYDTCCHPNYGAGGNPTCWDGNWGYDTCCLPDREL